jgi:hypothetical protein
MTARWSAFGSFRTDTLRVVVALRAIVDRTYDALGGREIGGDGFTDICRESGDAAASRHIVPEEGDVPGIGQIFHGLEDPNDFERLTMAATCYSPQRRAVLDETSYSLARNPSGQPAMLIAMGTSITFSLRIIGRYLRCLLVYFAPPREL